MNRSVIFKYWDRENESETLVFNPRINDSYEPMLFNQHANAIRDISRKRSSLL